MEEQQTITEIAPESPPEFKVGDRVLFKHHLIDMECDSGVIVGVTSMGMVYIDLDNGLKSFSALVSSLVHDLSEKRNNWASLDPAYRKLIEDCPQSPIISGWFRNVFQIIPPKGLETLPAWREWYENAVLPIIKPVPAPSRSRRDYVVPTVAITYEFEEIETGTCSYSQRNHYSGRVNVPLSILEGLTEEDEIKDALYDYVRDTQRDHADSSGDDIEYEDLSCDDVEEVDFSSNIEEVAAELAEEIAAEDEDEQEG